MILGVKLGSGVLVVVGVNVFVVVGVEVVVGVLVGGLPTTANLPEAVQVIPTNN